MGHPEDGVEARLRALSDFARRATNPTLTQIVDATTADVVTAFEQAGIPVLVLKGPALARHLYRPGERRNYMDVDLLVPYEAREPAGTVLRNLGYESTYAEHGVDEFTGAVHAESWHSDAKGWMPVDLHWRLAGCEAAPETVWRQMSADPLSVEIGHRTIPVPALRALALHAAIHAAQHGPEDHKAMGDLERAVERWPLADWQAATRLAAELEATETFGAGLRLAPKGIELAQTLALPETPELLWEIVNRGTRPRGTFHLRALQKAQGPREALRVVWRSLMPSPAWIAHEYVWARGGRLRLVAGYVRHMLRSPAWAARAWRFQRRARARR